MKSIVSKKWIAAILSLALVFSFVGSGIAYAETQEDVKNEISEIENAQDEVSKELAQVEDDIKDLNEKIDDISSDIKKTSSEISETEDEIAQKQVEMQERETNLNARLRAMYKNGSVGFMDILLGSNSIADFIANMELVQKIYENDVNVLETLNEEHEELEVIKTKLKAQKHELAEQQEELDVEKENLDEKKKELEEKEDQFEADAKALEAKLQEMIAAAQASSSKKESASKGNSENSDSNSGSDSTPSYGSGEFTWPCPSSHYITSYYGYRMHPVLGVWKYHSGMDIAASTGADIVAAQSGTVIMAQVYGGYGNCVVIDHGGGITTLYGHASQILVSVGQEVSKGEKIAVVGSTGISSGPHLHFEVRKDGAVTEPLDYL